MKSTQMQLDEFFLTRLRLDWWTGESEGDEDSDQEIDIDYNVARHHEKPNLFRLELSVGLPVADGCRGVDIDARIVGFFSFPEDVEEKEMQYVVRVNGATILYGLLRGQIAMATGSFPQGKFNLPAVVMQDVLPEIDRAKANNDNTNETAEEDAPYGD